MNIIDPNCETIQVILLLLICKFYKLAAKLQWSHFVRESRGYIARVFAALDWKLTPQNLSVYEIPIYWNWRTQRKSAERVYE